MKTARGFAPAASGGPALRAGAPAAGGQNGTPEGEAAFTPAPSAGPTSGALARPDGPASGTAVNIGGPAPQTTPKIGGPAPQTPRSISAKMKDSRLPRFVPALLDPAAAVPDGLVDAAGRVAGKRFDVYRNNVVVSLSEALAAGFPVIGKLVGAEFFTAMAGVFVRAHPPRSPVMTLYGDEFPGFLETFPPVAHLPYLADTARLEYALREAYHAADARPVPRERLEDPALVEARLSLAPATRLVASAYPIHAIWRANTEPGAPPAEAVHETVLVTRPDWDPKPVVIAPDAALFVTALLAGHTFGEALDAAGNALDLARILTILIDTKSITQIEVPA